MVFIQEDDFYSLFHAQPKTMTLAHLHKKFRCARRGGPMNQIEGSILEVRLARTRIFNACTSMPRVTEFLVLTTYYR